MDSQKDDIVKNIRACLLSRKGKCTLGQLMGDYRTLIGGNIPYGGFNFRNLEDFLRSVDSLMLHSMSGQIFVEAKLDEKSKHVAELIQKQKPPKKKSRDIPMHYIKRYTSPMPQTQNRWRPKNIVPNKWRTSYEGTRRPDQVDHRQYVKVTRDNNRSGSNVPPHLQYPQTTYRNDRPLAPVSNNVPPNTVNHRGGGAEKTTDLRQVLNARKPQDGAQSGPPGAQHPHKVPHSERTNRSNLMQGIVKRNTANLSPTQVRNLRNASIEAVDMQSPVWDSWTSSSDEENRSQELVFTGDMIVDLYNFAKYHKLSEPNFKVVQRAPKLPLKPRASKTMFDCKLTVGEHTYRSYPTEFYDEKTVRQYVAALALKDLTPKYKKRQSMLISNDQDVLNRIPELVEKHYHGIWKWQLEADYTDIYKEVLPLNWLEIVDRSQSISVEPCLADQYVLRCCKPEDNFQKGKRPIGGPASEVSVPTNTINFREDGTLIAEITSIVSAKEVWCRQIGTTESDSFDQMINEFAEVYKELKQRKALRKPATLTQGGYYAALSDGFWHRVRVFEVGENDVNCFFIDYGDEEWVTKEDLYQLEREFAKHQAQAFICCLAGLEELYEVSINSVHLHQLVGREVQLETDIAEQVSHSPNTLISAVLYDTENNNNISINQTLIAQITIESATPTLNKNTVSEAFVSHTEENGDIYVTIQSPGYEKMLALLAEVKENIVKDPTKVPKSVRLTPERAEGQLFLARYKKNDDDVNNWQRVKIIDWAPTHLYAQLYFVDIGDCSIANLSTETIYPLDQLSDVLNQFPAQAVKVRMDVDRIPTDFVEKVNELMPQGMPVLLKLIEVNVEADCSVVKFFKRIGPSNDLCSINESISFDEECRTSQRPEKLQRLISLSKIDDAKNMPSTGILSTPRLPEVGVYYDVKVPFAVNPWNFFVQPYESNVKLDQLMDEMQRRYGNVTFSPLQIEDIIPGRIYASKHEDGKWYRTSVMKVIHSGSISVFYCDFGYYANLTLQQLIPLDHKFLSLEYQAIKAKLHGIAPKQSKWTMEDCKYFQKLVCRKSLVSILVSVDKDELYRGDSILNLKLIDTSTDIDVNIDDVLVRKGIAKRVSQPNGQ